MYICLCNGVTDKDIRAAADSGVSTLEALQLATGCATNCGSCADYAMDILSSRRGAAPSRSGGMPLGLPILQ